MGSPLAGTGDVGRGVAPGHRRRAGFEGPSAAVVGAADWSNCSWSSCGQPVLGPVGLQAGAPELVRHEEQHQHSGSHERSTHRAQRAPSLHEQAP